LFAYFLPQHYFSHVTLNSDLWPQIFSSRYSGNL